MKKQSMFDNMIDVILYSAFIFLVIGYTFSWLFGIITAMLKYQSVFGIVIDIFLSLAIPFYGFIIWLIYLFS